MFTILWGRNSGRAWLGVSSTGSLKWLLSEAGWGWNHRSLDKAGRSKWLTHMAVLGARCCLEAQLGLSTRVPHGIAPAWWSQGSWASCVASGFQQSEYSKRSKSKLYCLFWPKLGVIQHHFYHSLLVEALIHLCRFTWRGHRLYFLMREMSKIWGLFWKLTRRYFTCEHGLHDISDKSPSMILRCSREAVSEKVSKDPAGWTWWLLRALCWVDAYVNMGDHKQAGDLLVNVNNSQGSRVWGWLVAEPQASLT